MMYRLSFSRRIWLSFVLLITLAITATGTLSYFIAASVVQKNAFRSSQDTVNKAAQILDDRLKNTANAILALMLSDPFKEVMKDVQRGNKGRYYSLLSSLQPAFSQVGFSDPLIQNILITTPIGDFYQLNFNRNLAVSFYDTPVYEEIKKTRRGVWMQGHKDRFFTGGQRVLSLVVEAVAEDTLLAPSDCYVIVNIKENELLRLSTQNLSKDGRDYYVINDNGEQVIPNQPSVLPVWGDKRPDFLQRISGADQGSFFYDTDKNSYLLNYTRLDINRNNGWMVVGIQSKTRLLQEVRNIKQTTFLVILGFILLSLIFSNRLTTLLLRPLYKLQTLMRRVEDNDLTVRFESKFQDEVAQVGSRFNRMLDEISRLIDDVKHSENEKRRAEMKALTAQMNPHFFYNTLNTIYCKSVLGENQDASAMILALSDMFQLGLNVGKDLIPLADELRHVEQFIAIQQMSYEHLFTYTVDLADEDLLRCLVPKIILQPLVENSILHGFQDIRSGGQIRIGIKADEGRLHLTVSDNGAGMDTRIPIRTEPPIHLQAENNSRVARHGYAMGNIRNRLKLYYGADALLQMTSSPEGGTTVTIILPLSEEVQDDGGY
jgi:two-component system sensor histidine kinase YesM